MKKSIASGVTCVELRRRKSQDERMLVSLLTPLSLVLISHLFPRSPSEHPLSAACSFSLESNVIVADLVSSGSAPQRRLFRRRFRCFGRRRGSSNSSSDHLPPAAVSLRRAPLRRLRQAHGRFHPQTVPRALRQAHRSLVSEAVRVDGGS